MDESLDLTTIYFLLRFHDLEGNAYYYTQTIEVPVGTDIADIDAAIEDRAVEFQDEQQREEKSVVALWTPGDFEIISPAFGVYSTGD